MGNVENNPCWKAIQEVKSYKELKSLWKSRDRDKNDGIWKKGKLMEYIIIRAFELKKEENNLINVSYPFNVNEEYVKGIVEQIDGAVHYNDLHALIECKDYESQVIDVVPLAKLYLRLQMRPSTVFGIFFSNTRMTEPAEYILKFMSPQMIIYWDVDDFEYCLDNDCFIDCLNTKYRYAIENREYNFHYYQSIKTLPQCQPLF